MSLSSLITLFHFRVYVPLSEWNFWGFHWKIKPGITSILLIADRLSGIEFTGVEWSPQDIGIAPLRSRGQATPQDQQQYMCGECGKGYKWMDNLRRHQRLECNKKPKYSCVICDKTFYRRYELKNHVNTKHARSWLKDRLLQR